MLARLAESLQSGGIAVTLATFDGAAPAFPVSCKHVPLSVNREGPSVGRTLFAMPKLISRLRSLMRSGSFDLVISFMDQNNMVTLIAACGLAIPVVVSERIAPQFSSITELPRPLNVISLYLRKLLYRRASAIVVQTEAAARYFKERGLTGVRVIPNAARTPPRDINSPISPLPRPCILSLSRLVAQKRVDRIINAFSAAVPRFNTWHLIIAGDGALKSALEQQARDCGFATRIHFIGTVTDPLALLAQSDIFVLASDYEGFPGALLEAMSMGVSSVAMRCPYGPEEIIRDGVDGRLVPLGNEQALVDVLAGLMADPQLREKLGSAARGVVSRFGEREIVDQWISLIDSLCLTRA